MGEGTTKVARPMDRLIAAYDRLVAVEAALDGRNSEDEVNTAVAATCAAEKSIIAEPVADMLDAGTKLVWMGRLAERHATNGVPVILLPALAALHADVARLVAAERYQIAA